MWQEAGEEDVRSCWMTLRTGEDALIWRRRLWIALCGGIVLEEALDLSSDRLLNNNNTFIPQTMTVHTAVSSKASFKSTLLHQVDQPIRFCRRTDVNYATYVDSIHRTSCHIHSIPVSYTVIASLINILSTKPSDLISIQITQRDVWCLPVLAANTLPKTTCPQLLQCFNLLLLPDSLHYCKNIFSYCWFQVTFIVPDYTTWNRIVTGELWFAMESSGLWRNEATTVMRRLTTGICSEKCVVRRFRRCANVTQCTYTNPDSIAYCTASLYVIAYCC